MTHADPWSVNHYFGHPTWAVTIWLTFAAALSLAGVIAARRRAAGDDAMPRRWPHDRLNEKVARKEVRERSIEMLRRVGLPRPQERLDAYSFPAGCGSGR